MESELWVVNTDFFVLAWLEEKEESLNFFTVVNRLIGC